jgi:hypothetical protein
MTETEWLACTDVEEMLRNCLLQMSVRKRRLFLCACCRRAWHLMDVRSRRAVEAAEEYADGRLTLMEVKNTLNRAGRAVAETGATLRAAPLTSVGLGEMLRTTQDLARAALATIGERPEIWTVMRTVVEALSQSGTESSEAVAADLSNLLRELVGDPFRPAQSEAAWLAWNDGTVRRIAQAIYDRQGFREMPILADALEEAGCDDERILRHCREPGHHTRGCWMIDLILGKS